MSFGENIPTLHASDLVAGDRVSPRGRSAEDERPETRHLREENRHLNLCLMLMREQAALESANLISSVIAWCDDRFRKKFADMSLGEISRQKVVSPFRPISPPGATYGNKQSTFSTETIMGSPLTMSQLISGSPRPDQSHLLASNIGQGQSPAAGRSKSPVTATTTARSYSPTESVHRQTQSSGTGTLSQAGNSRQSPHSFMSGVQGHISPSSNAAFGPPPPSASFGGASVTSRPTGGRLASPRSVSSNVSERPTAPVRSLFSPGAKEAVFTGSATGGEVAYSNRPDRPPSPGSTYSNRPERPPSPRSPYGIRSDRPPSPGSTYSNRPERPPSPRSPYGIRSDRPPSPGSTYSNRPERPSSPRSSYGNRPDRPPSPKSAYNSISHRPASPKSTFFKVSDRPASPRSAFNSSFDRSSSTKTADNSKAGRTSSPKPDFGTRAFVGAQGRPPSPRHTSPSSSPHTSKLDADLNKPATDQSGRYNTSFQPEPRITPEKDAFRRLQYNQFYGNPSVRLPRETEVSAAYNSQFNERSNFSATLEVQDLSATIPTLNRPDSSAFVPALNESSFQTSKVQNFQTRPQPSAPPYTTTAAQSVRPASPREQCSLEQQQQGQAPGQQYQGTGQFSQTGQGFYQGHPSARVPSPSLSPEPTRTDQTSTSGQSREPRTLTPFPEMHTRDLPNNMLSIKEEMESELRSRGASPVLINQYTEQIFGQPMAASTPKNVRPTSPAGYQSPRKKMKSPSPKGRAKSPAYRSLRKGVRSPSPKGRKSPSPVSDDSFKAQSRRSATNVKPSHRILGEIAFQLERRVLDYVFARYRNTESRERARRRFYGYTVSNIETMIQKESLRHDGTIDSKTEFQLKYRLKYVITSLGPFGYELNRHGLFCQEMINKYGLLSSAPDRKTMEAFGLADADTLREFVVRLAGSEAEKRDMLVLLECLFVMAHDDGRAIFLW